MRPCDGSSFVVDPRCASHRVSLRESPWKRNASAISLMSRIFVHLPGNMYKKANVYRMANDTIVKFIELYRSCECLWNVSSEDYGCRLSRNAAYSTISRKMRIPGFGPREVARKIKNLRSAYQREVKRIEDSEQNRATVGTVYRPGVVWFDLLDDFLRNDEANAGKPNRPYPGTNDPSESPEKASSMEEEEEKNVTDSPKKFSLYDSGSDEIAHDAESRKRKSSDDAYRVQEEEERRKRNKTESSAIEFEEYESFGKYVASSLSRMPFEYAVSAETEIHSVVIKYKVYAMRKIVYPTTKTTRTETREDTTTYSPSAYFSPTNFSPVSRRRTEETRPSSVDSIGRASD